MIKVIGLNNDVFTHILTYYGRMVYDCNSSCNMIEFIPECCLDLSNASVAIQYDDESVKFLCCDCWRIEIE